MKNKKILVTGGLGFIGSNLTLRLLELGAQVTVIDNLQENLGGNQNNLPKNLIDKIWLNKDVSDWKTFADLPKDFDIIYHCSSQTSHLDSMNEPTLDMQINIGGAINVALFAMSLLKKPHVIYAGTRAQVGKPAEFPVKEDTLGVPTDIYGINKNTADQIFQLYAKGGKFKFTSLIITNCYGYRHQMKHSRFGVLNWFIRLAMDNQEISIYGDGAQMREYLFVDDVVEAFVAAANAPQQVNRYIIGSDLKISVKNVAELIIKNTGTGNLKLTPWPDDRKVIETGDWVSDFSKANRELSWKPKFTFEEGLKKTISFYKENKVKYW